MPSPPPPGLVDHLTALELICREPAWDMLKGGRTNRVWNVRTRDRELVLKLYRSGAENPLFPNRPDHEIACLGLLRGTGLAPRLAASGEFGGITWILYEFVQGDCWSRDVSTVARLLADLHKMAAPEWLPAKPGGSEALVVETKRILARCGASAHDYLLSLEPVGEVPESDRLSLIHGDPVPGNIIVAQERPVLIDWQCPANGDPCEDLGVFLSPAMQSLYRGRPLDLSEESHFLATCPDPAVAWRTRRLRPWFHWRMAAYCQWQSEQGNADYEAGLELELAGLLNRPEAG